MTLNEVSQVVRGQLLGSDAEFRGVSTDTRTLRVGEIFIALKGERFDGHDCVEQLREKGAAGALVDHEISAPVPVVVASDTRQALVDLASHWRRRFSMPCVGITGSSGKTTVKEMIAAICREAGSVLATAGNFNNDIGVPKTLFDLDETHNFAVIEMGANHRGEIKRLAAMAAPTVGVVTLCAPAHLEGFGSVRDVARAKGEMFESLNADATAVINRDDVYYEYWQSLVPLGQSRTFGASAASDYRIDLKPDGKWVIVTPAGEIRPELELLGAHNRINAAAAAAAAHALGISLGDIERGLGKVKAVRGRLALVRGRGGMRIIYDTYNANPASVNAAIDVLADQGSTRWMLFGDMGELGEQATALHEEIGTYAAARGIDQFWAIGELSKSSVKAFGKNARHFSERDALIAALQESADPNITLLAKASRSMRLDEIVEALTSDGDRC
ncbi:MAG: UDP-N-acetylmuramoyl-tripeptide--D-alanyl-D-alanine ligase [Pseudomonadota bacterium]